MKNDCPHIRVERVKKRTRSSETALICINCGMDVTGFKLVTPPSGSMGVRPARFPDWFSGYDFI